ncbi:L-rhamnose-binding lectin CSL2-like [Pimephales promelas]|uniref:L-rhamnose-binding lectin CSL2-like n=1 Tax=Pimephales promelas TaxID=90988 RepID=UPI0019556D92|nr:L-rhamnose-binding lectin CSL2-like [Pimephales promelas]
MCLLKRIQEFSFCSDIQIVYTFNMLVQKLSWITLLLFLYQQGAEAKRTLICGGGSAYLSCELGYIKVINANYGRTDHTTCASGKPTNQISNTHCFQETSLYTMSKRCDGRRTCSVLAESSVFSDPCFGTYKYLDVTYDCIPAKRSIICEETQSIIICDTGTIHVHHANYGRRDLITCPHKLATSPHCYSPQTSSLRSRCDGRTSCHLHASSYDFSDQCWDVYKYLEVTYTCK